MSSQTKIDANRENAQHSTGPTSDAGKQRSSLNATRHGFTGQSLVLTPEEKENYDAHVKSYFEEYDPFDAVTRQLTQQLADAQWSLHQIFVQQSNLSSLIDAATLELRASGTAVAAAIAIMPFTKTLQNYSMYEQRRRRAADAIEQKLMALLDARAEKIQEELPNAAKVSKLYKAQGKAFDPSDLGFVCSNDQVEEFLMAETIANEFKNSMKKE